MNLGTINPTPMGCKNIARNAKERLHVIGIIHLVSLHIYSMSEKTTRDTKK